MYGRQAPGDIMKAARLLHCWKIVCQQVVPAGKQSPTSVPTATICAAEIGAGAWLIRAWLMGAWPVSDAGAPVFSCCRAAAPAAAR